MYTIRSKVGPTTALLGLVTILITFSLMGCDGANSGMSVESEGVVSQSETSSLTPADIEFARVVSQLNKFGESKLLLRVGLRKTSRWHGRLEGLRVLSRTRNGKPVIIRDDGKNGDLEASDGVFSGYVPDGCLPDEKHSPAAKKYSLSCTVAIVGPGNECGDFGTCPDRVHRSLFWGLIEYDTNVVICICLTECTFSNG